MDELGPGIVRLRLDLPLPPGHVNAYLVEADGGWLLVDTGLAAPGLREVFAGAVGKAGVGVQAIVITHFHPDHVGGAQIAAEALGVAVLQGALDFAQCRQVWGNPGWPVGLGNWLRAHGAPPKAVEDLPARGEALTSMIRFAPQPTLVHAGDLIGGWQVIDLPGHADGHIGLLRDGVLLAGDHLLPDITPTIGLYPDSRSDPLGDYLGSLDRTLALRPSRAFPGHGDPIDDPPARVRALAAHHAKRLEETAALLAAGPSNGFELSLALFGDALDPVQRRFAIAEALAHAERLVTLGAVRRNGDGGSVSYTAA